MDSKGFWYETYNGSGRPTWRTMDTEPLYPDGRPNSDWVRWDGSQQEFDDFCWWEEHKMLHDRQVTGCPYCTR